MNRLLELHLSQAQQALSRAKNNNYSDKAKENYQQNLEKLFSSIVTNNAQSPPKTEAEIVDIKRELDFIFKSLEFLESSTLNLIPFELVECLKYAMTDWLKVNDQYIITTSLINTVNRFSFDNTLFTGNPLFLLFKIKYNLDFKDKLVLINFPKATARDYLISVVLYHELGHFIDHRYKISKAIANDLFDKYTSLVMPLNTNDVAVIEKYFVFLKSLDRSNPLSLANIRAKLESYFAEYFCDLFASQYIGDCSNNYIQYLSIENKNTNGLRHPATNLRVELVEEFLSGKTNFLLEFIKSGTKLATGGKEIKIRYENLKPDDFYNFLPVDVKNIDQLHGLYKLGWDIWKSNWKPFEVHMGLKKPLERERVYSIINNLIEKSIGNYVIKEKWQKAKAKA